MANCFHWAQETAVSKYGNRKTLFAGAEYDSQLEADYALQLEARLRTGDIVSISRQIPFELYGRNGGQVATYRADFLVTLPNGRREVHEAKGYMTPLARLKLKLFQDCYPELDLFVNGELQWRKKKRRAS